MSEMTISEDLPEGAIDFMQLARTCKNCGTIFRTVRSAEMHQRECQCVPAEPSHAADCAVAVNGRHDCSCRTELPGLTGPACTVWGKKMIDQIDAKDRRIAELKEQVRDGVTYGMLMKSREMVADLQSANASLTAELFAITGKGE